MAGDRPITNRRPIREDRGDAYQYVIDREPCTVQVVHYLGDGIKQHKTPIISAEFQARLHWQRISGRNLEQRVQGGSTTATAYLLLMRKHQDKFGNAIQLARGDDLIIKETGEKFHCTMLIDTFSYKTEATVEKRD